MLHSLSKDTAFTGETAPRHTFLCGDSQCLPPGDPRILCAKQGYPITGKSFICVIEKRPLLETYTTNRPYMSLDNNQEVLFYQNPVSNLFLTRGLNETTIFRPCKLMDY